MATEIKNLRVVIGVIWNEGLDEILISQRPETKNFGGLWEFPGGKVEINESDIEALDRELAEEVGILVTDFVHRIDFTHNDDDKCITFIVYDIYSFEGDPEGKEGQLIKWCPIYSLDPENFPPADVKLIEQLRSGAMPDDGVDYL